MKASRGERPTMAELRARYPHLAAGAPDRASEPKPTPNYSDKPCALSPAAMGTVKGDVRK
jgi:hypothetical protein